MENRNLPWLKRPSFLIIILSIAFILKGVVFASIIPVFQGSDEYIHYATVQYLAEPEEKTWPITEEKRDVKKTKDIPSFHYTQEIIGFSSLTQSWNLSGKPHNTQNFNPEEISNVEKEMKSGRYIPYIDQYPPDIVHRTQLAHQIGSILENSFSDNDFFYRYFMMRILSVLYGLITVVCAYFIALWSGMRKKHSVIFSGIIAFHPMLSATTSIINYDPLLIALYSIFILSSTSIFKHGLKIINISGMIIAAILAMLTKGVGGVLIILSLGIIAWTLRKKISALKNPKNIAIAIIIFLSIITILYFAPSNFGTILTHYAKPENTSFFHSVSDYLNDHVFDSGKYERTSVTYWGTFGWLDTQLHESVMSIIRFIQYISVLGLIILVLSYWKNCFLFKKMGNLFFRLKEHLSKKKNLDIKYLFENKDFLPQKKFLLFFLLSIIILQAAVRFYDWKQIFEGGEGMGTPGRYFLPNIIPHFMLVVTGLGIFARSSRAFGIILKIIFILMVILCLYSIFLIIIPRYYL